VLAAIKAKALRAARPAPALTAAARDAQAFEQAGRKDGSNRTKGSLNEEKKEDKRGSAA
jgi:hypothetical protein